MNKILFIVKKQLFLYLIFTIILLSISFLKNYFYIFFVSDLKINLKQNFSNKNFVIFIILTLLLTLSMYFEKKFFIFLNYKMNKKITNKIINFFICKNTFFNEQKKNEKLFLLNQGVTNFIEKNLMVKISAVTEILSFVVNVISIAVFAPLFFIYPILTYVLMGLIIISLKKTTKEIGLAEYALFKKPMEYSKDYLDSSFNYLVNGKNVALRKKFENKFDHYLKKTIKKFSKIYASYTFSVESLAFLFSSILIAISIFISFYYPKLMSFAVLAAIISRFSFFQSSFSGIANNAGKIKYSKEEFLEALKNSGVSKSFYKNNKEINELKNHNFQFLKIENLNFKVDQKIILNSIDLKIKKGDKILIQGESGSGKSSLAKIIMGNQDFRFVNVKKMIFNDKEIDEKKFYDLHKNVYFVPHKNIFFEGTLIENVSFEKNFDIEKIKKEIKILKLEKLKWNENVDLINPQYSLGEIQRINILRSMLINKDFFIYDESFSNIDEKTAEEVISYLLNTKNTMIIIFHNINEKLKAQFNKIWKIEKGELNEIS